MQSKSAQHKVALELFLLSFASLYLELFVIRWLSADIRAFTVFRTFPLITCFVGLGVGLAIEKDTIFKYSAAALLQLVAVMFLADFLNVSYMAFPSVSVWQWDGLLLLRQSPIYLAAFMLLLILLLAGPFAVMACIGARLGALFRQLKPLSAYSFNLLGALFGSIAFPLVCYLGWQPWQAALPAGAILAWFSARYAAKAVGQSEGSSKKIDWKPFACLLAIPICAFVIPRSEKQQVSPELAAYKSEAETLWSPYQRVDIVTATRQAGASAKGAFLGLQLGVNRCLYQYFFLPDIERAGLSKPLCELLDERDQQYALPFELSKPKDVLVVGAGTGQNVSAAIAKGASAVDAVEIDPAILQVGKRYNPVYASPHVNLVCDDARHFFSVCRKKYDLISFSLLDSHVVTGQGSSVRIDSYVYTRESIEQALHLLKPGGLLVLSFNSAVPWIGPRIYHTMEAAAGYPPLALTSNAREKWGSGDLFFVLGQNVRSGQITIPAGWTQTRFDSVPERILTDDWPYLYVQPAVFDVNYFLVVAQILLLSLWAARRSLFSGDSTCWQMFFLGAAFLMLELHAISFLSLVYGSTWITSAIVINAVLLMIFAANIFVMRTFSLLARHQPTIYTILIASILVSYFTPGSQLLHAGGPVSGATAAWLTVITVLPMGIAGVLFSTAFARATDSAKALSFNLFGALVGGLLEYLSNYTGIKALELIAAGLYLASLICYLSSRAKVQNTTAAAGQAS